MSELSESTAYLPGLYGAGNDAARNRLMAPFLPILRPWAHGRLLPFARANPATDDLVQLTPVRSLNPLEDFVSNSEGVFLAYLRTLFLNPLRDEFGWAISRLAEVIDVEKIWA